MSETETGSEESTATPGSGGNQNKVQAVLVAGLLMAVVPMVVIFGAGGGCSGETEGQVQVTGGPHGDFTFVPTDCHSMQPYGRMGANVHGDGHNDGAVYASMDPIEGPRVDVEVPGSCRNADGTDCTVFRLPRESCTTYEVRVSHTNVTVNDVRLVQGRVQLDCTLEDGTHVAGQLRFDGC